MGRRDLVEARQSRRLRRTVRRLVWRCCYIVASRAHARLCAIWTGCCAISGARLRADPEAVAYWAAWPTIHQDLTARHTWLRQWRVEHGGKVETDPDFYDVKVAGWWVWGLSNWIGGGWCSGG